MSRLVKWLCAALLAGSCAAAAAQPVAPSPQAPRLVIVVVIDQFAADLLDRWLPQFHGGLQRLAREGVVYRSAYHAHGITETCAGHATLMTGRHPRNTGIVANYWLDRKTGKPISCVAAPDNRLAHDARAAGLGPEQLLTSTLGDWLKSASPNSRVVSVAGKDRAAIMLGGHHADAAFWYADDFGFTTYVRPGEQPQARLAAVAKFNASLRAEFAQRKPWTYSSPECARLEDSYRLATGTWRSGLPAKKTASFGSALPPPVLDSITLDAAEHLITTLHMARNGVTDLLLIGLSGTDRVGHYFGTRGPEMCDHLLRLDRRLGKFLSFIEATKLPVLVAVSADHGAADFPERLRKNGYGAGRFHAQAWLTEVNRHLAAQSATAAIHLVSALPQVLSQLMLVDATGHPLEPSARTAALPAALAAVRSAPHVREAYSLEELEPLARHALHTGPRLLSVAERLALSANAQHASDILVAFEPLQYSIDAAPGVLLETHGSPYDYDRRVPMLFWWPGVVHSERLLPVATVDFAPTLAAAIGIPAPSEVNGRCLGIDAYAAATCSGS